MMRGAASTNGKNRARKARQRHHPYERKSIPVEANKSGNLEEDRISKLPDEILITILSLLTIKEAGRSSVLSSRWRYLWTFFTGKLDIGYKDNGTRKREDILLSEVFEKLENYQHSFGYNRDMFNIDELDKVLMNFQKCLDIPVSESGVVRNINEVLKSHQGLFLEELGIHFPYLEKYSRDVDSWLKFASSKCVSRFELDLEGQPEDYAKRPKIYKLQGAKRLFTSSNPAHNSFTSLTSLHLRYVNVSGEILEHFLANCHFLKQLRVIHSGTLVKLNVTGPSLKLELLEISDCYLVRFLNISAENLVSLTYIGPSEPLVLSNVPLLSQMSIAGDILSSLENKSCKHYTAIQQLQSLRVTMEELTGTVEPKSRPNFPVLHCLKQLELNIEDTYGKDLMFYVSLVKACPLLYRLAMRYTYVEMDPSIEEGEELYVIRDREKRLEKTDKTPIKVTAEFQHLSLKVVELIGFIGYETDLELVFSLVEIAVSLEKLVIEPSKHYPGESRRRVRKLEEDLPSSVNLLVL